MESLPSLANTSSGSINTPARGSNKTSKRAECWYSFKFFNINNTISWRIIFLYFNSWASAVSKIFNGHFLWTHFLQLGHKIKFTPTLLSKQSTREFSWFDFTFGCIMSKAYSPCLSNDNFDSLIFKPFLSFLSILSSSSSVLAAMTNSSAYNRSQGQPIRNSCYKASMTIIKEGWEQISINADCNIY